MKYNTKRIKKQVLYWEIILGTTWVLSIVFCGLDNYTKNYISELNTKEVFKHEFIQVAKAETLNSEKPKIAEVAKESVEVMIRRIAKEECDKQKLGDYCVDDLVAIGYTESRFDCNVIGDGGKSFGCFQIHRGWHPDVSVAQAKDLKFAINWTLNRMVHYGYPTMRSYSIMKHNGTPGTVKTKAYLATVNNFLKK